MMKRVIAIIMVVALVMGNNVSVLASEIGDAGQAVSEEGGMEVGEEYQVVNESGNNEIIVTSIDDFQSSHDYLNNQDTTWIYTVENAEALSVVFSDECEVEEDYDYINIYDKDGISLGGYTGTALAGKTVIVNGDTIKVRLTSDESSTAYGFSVASVTTTNREEYDYELIIEDNVVTGYTGIPVDVVIPNGVTGIGDRAFLDCKSIRSISMSEGVTSIEDRAFRNCSSLAEIEIPKSIEYIGEDVFKGTKWLAGKKEKGELIIVNNMLVDGTTAAGMIEIPNGVISILGGAFQNNTNLTGVSIPNSVKTIGSSAFWGCSNLTEIVIPESMTSISSFTFFGCSNLADITIPETVTMIGAGAFDETVWLTNKLNENPYVVVNNVLLRVNPEILTANIPDEVTVICSYAFSSCNNITSVEIPSGVTKIDGIAFSDCPNLTTIIIPESVTSITDVLCSNCGDVPLYGKSGSYAETYAHEYGIRFIPFSEELDAVYTITFNANGGKDLGFESKEVNANEVIGTLPTVSKENATFRGWYTAETGGYLVTEDMPVTIGMTLYAQWEYVGLIIEDGVVIGYSGALVDVVIPDGVLGIGDYAFERCSSLTSIKIPDSVTSIGDYAFYNCSSLTNIEIQDGVTSIGDYAFSGCGELTGVEIPNSVTSIGGYAFFCCSGLKNITLSNNVTYIGNSVFDNCSSLTSIEIPNGVTSIGIRAFCGCSSLINIGIPDSVTEIGGNAFLGTPWLEEKRTENPIVVVNNILVDGKTAGGDVVVPDGVTSIGGSAFDGCSSITSFEIPNSVTSIGSSAFAGCSSITGIEIPNSVTSIGNAAFYDCSNLISIEIPEGVTTITYSTFGECNKLTSIIIPEGVTNIADNTFGGRTDFTIYGKKGSYAETFANSKRITFAEIDDKDKTIIYTVNFNANGGINLSIAAKEVEENQPVGTLPTAERAGYIFKGWYTSATGGTQISEKTVITGDTTFFAQWEKEIISIESARLELSQDSFIYDGTEKKPTITVILNGKALTQGTDYTVDYSNYVESGSGTVTITGIGNYTGSISAAYTITKADISKAEVILSATSFAYDGTEKQPTVIAKLGDKTLALETDYTVSYTNNTAVGTAMVTITGKGNYTGTISQTYTITAASINDAKVTLSATSYNYDGKAKKPGVTVMLGDKKLGKDDYVVTYKNNKNIGTATVTITGKGNYTGTLTQTFTITLDTGSTFISGKYKYKVTGPSTVTFNGIASTKTTKVSIPKTVKYGGKTFKVTSVAEKALKGKTKVTQITIGANVTKIGTSAFEGCTKLSKVTMGANVTSIGASAFKGCSKLTKISMGKKVKTIGVSAFEGCKKLSKVTIGSAVTTIEDKAFENCTSLKSITIPSKVTKIGKQAFYGCKKLKTIIIKSAKLKTVGKDALKGINAKAVIKVPKSKLKSYQNLLKKKGQGSRVKIVIY